MKLRFLAALLLLAPFSQMAKADLCADPTTHAYITCAAAPDTTSGQTLYDKTSIASPNSLSQTFDVVSYGAKCDTATDDTTAIQAALTAAKTWYNSATYHNVKILFPAYGQCYVTALLNFTGFTNTSNRVVVEGQGAWIHWTTTPNALIDAMGSQNMSWRNLMLQGNATYNGLQIGRTVSVTTPSGLMTFDNVGVFGAFGDGACYSYAAEQVLWNFVTCSNTSIVGGFGLVMDGSNHWNVPTVASGGQLVAADTATSFLQNTFIQGQFKAQAGPVGAGIWMGNAQQVRFDNSYCYITATAGPAYGVGCVWLYETDGGASDFGLKDAKFDLHIEPALTNSFYITGPGSGTGFTATPTIRGLTYKDAYIFASTDLFATAAAANITTVTLQDATIEALGGPAVPTFGSFDTPANYTFSGKFISYSAARWNGVSYTGNYYVEQAGVGKSYTGGEVSGLSLLSGSNVQAASTGQLTWSTRGILTSPAAGQVQLGNTNAASPVAQTLSAQGSRGGTDSNVAGANVTIQSGLGTGNATGSTLTLATPHAGSTGTTAQTATAGIVLSDAQVALSGSTITGSATAKGANTINAASGLYDTGIRASRVICAAAVASAAAGGGSIAAAHTGGTGEFNLAVCTVPANTIPANSMFRVTAVWLRTAVTTNTVTWTLRHSASSAAVSGGSAYSSASATNAVLSYTSIWQIFVPSTSAQFAPFGNGNVTTATNTSVPSVGAVDLTATSYLNFNCADTSSASDTCGLYGYVVELLSP